ncbi:MAG: hypothetical protein E7B50_06945 [Negativicoccus succinicivorans]|nr:hypothetical protein [Negativicoccus succinicivorans]
MILKMAAEEWADHFSHAENYPFASANVYNKWKVIKSDDGGKG